MEISHIEIGPSGARNALVFHAVTTTVGGVRIEATVRIHAGTLHQQMLRGARNHARSSKGGALTVDIREVSDAV